MRLETERLIVREFTISDLDAFAHLMADPEVMRFSLSGPLNREQAKTCLQKGILEHYLRYGYGLYGVFCKASNCLIGYVGLMAQSIDGESKTELGYRLLPQYWGKGLATEACLAVCQYAFTQLGLNELISIIDPQNKRSIDLAKRIRMHYWKNSLFHHIPVNIYMLKKLTIEPFQENWHNTFEIEKTKLLNVFTNLDIDFYHIGSTAIPDCRAKPIIDILGVTADITKIDSYSETISELGYEAMGEFGIKQRRYFRRKNDNPVHLHIFEDPDPEAERHLRFVTHLKVHPELVKEYSEIKQLLVSMFPGDIDRYCLGKDKFVKKIDVMSALIASKPILKKKNVSRKKEWSQGEILKAMESNMHLQMTYFAKYLDSIELLFQPDVTVVRSSIVDDTFNYILSARFSNNNAQDRVSQILKLFKEHSLPFSWWVGPLDTPSNLIDVLTSQGLSFKEENIGMCLSLEDFKLEQLNISLNLQKVNSLLQLKDFSEVIVKIGGNSEVFSKIYSKLPSVLYQSAACFEMYVGYLNNAPVVTGILVLHANVGGIYYIATVPDQRKKGYGTAMMEYLIQRAKDQEYHMATLQASGEGKMLYQRLGFKEVCTFKEYSMGKH